MKSRPRLGSSALPADVDRAELLNEGYGWLFIDAAFRHAKPSGNRFNDEGRWYAAFRPTAAETEEAEVTYHIAHILREAAAAGELAGYRQLGKLRGAIPCIAPLSNFAKSLIYNVY